MSPLATQILSVLDSPDYLPTKAVQLAKKMGVGKNEKSEFLSALQELIDVGHVRQQTNGLLRRKQPKGLVTGIIKRAQGGFGFLTPAHAPADRSQDVYISQEDMRDAQTGDEVIVQMIRSEREDGKTRGRVVEITQRATHVFVGTYFERSGKGFVSVDGTTFSDPVYVGDPGAKGAQPLDKVVIEMLRFPSHRQTGEAVLTDVLGPRGTPGVDTLGVIYEFGLPDAFPEEVLEEARQQADLFDESNLEGRLDLTQQTIITIDPVDARDFDDAISLSRSTDGHWHLGVHIADVAHFVTPGSALDREAQKRGTSVYLPDRVLPMLPEVISNGLASLQQGRVRYTKSAMMEFDAEGMPLHAEFASSAINVCRRFAYEEVMPILNEPEKEFNDLTPEVRALLERMFEFAMILRKRRFKLGALELSMPEVKIDFDKQGKVQGAHVAPHDQSHEIIEEFMLAANIAVATALSDHKFPFLRRVHGAPDELKLRKLSDFVGTLGLTLTQFQSRFALQQLLKQVEDQPFRQAVNYALLRSMKQAEYNPEPIGHYALAVDHYCHFTSPIRRYPDLTIHRLIDVLANRKKKHTKPDPLGLIMLGKQCSAQERRADWAERELIKIKLLVYMKDRIGEELDAIITGVQDYGFYCQGIQIPAEGLVHVASLGDDYYYYEEAAFSLIGRRTGQEFRLGSQVRVAVARVDTERRQLDFRLVGSGPQVAKSQSAHSGAESPSGGRFEKGLGKGEKGSKKSSKKARPAKSAPKPKSKSKKRGKNR